MSKVQYRSSKTVAYVRQSRQKEQGRFRVLGRHKLGKKKIMLRLGTGWVQEVRGRRMYPSAPRCPRSALLYPFTNLQKSLLSNSSIRAIKSRNTGLHISDSESTKCPVNQIIVTVLFQFTATTLKCIAYILVFPPLINLCEIYVRRLTIHLNIKRNRVENSVCLILN